MDDTVEKTDEFEEYKDEVELKELHFSWSGTNGVLEPYLDGEDDLGATFDSTGWWTDDVANDDIGGNVVPDGKGNIEVLLYEE